RQEGHARRRRRCRRRRVGPEQGQAPRQGEPPHARRLLAVRGPHGPGQPVARAVARRAGREGRPVGREEAAGSRSVRSPGHVRTLTMARFLMMVKSSGKSLEAYEGGAQPDVELVKAMMKFNEELVNAGAWISGEGLHPSTKGARVRYVKGKASFVDGPFSEAKELIGGFWLARFANKQAALDMPATCPIPD